MVVTLIRFYDKGTKFISSETMSVDNPRKERKVQDSWLIIFGNFIK